MSRENVQVAITVDAPPVSRPGRRDAAACLSGRWPCVVCQQPLVGEIKLNKKVYKCGSCGASYKVRFEKSGDLLERLTLQYDGWEKTLTTAIRAFRGELKAAGQSGRQR